MCVCVTLCTGWHRNHRHTVCTATLGIPKFHLWSNKPFKAGGWVRSCRPTVPDSSWLCRVQNVWRERRICVCGSVTLTCCDVFNTNQRNTSFLTLCISKTSWCTNQTCSRFSSRPELPQATGNQPLFFIPTHIPESSWQAGFQELFKLEETYLCPVVFSLCHESYVHFAQYFRPSTCSLDVQRALHG